MTNTQPLAPTDAELDELRQANSGKLNFVTFSEFRTIASAVLAKWGAAAPVGVEPYGYVYAAQVATRVGDERKVIQTFFTQKKPPWEALPLYTTPQPTQAQAGVPCRKNPFYHGPRNCSRGTVGCCEDHGTATQAQAGAVPLTDEQWQRIADLTDSILTQATKDEIERVIGIKGGQHG